MARRAHKQWNENIEGRGRMEVVEKEKEYKWKPPEPGCLKLNCDVAVGANGLIGMEFVIRDAGGAVSLAGKVSTRAEGDSTLLEGLAMRYAMKMAKQHKLTVKSVESDSKNLVEAVNGRQKPIRYCDTVISDILDLARDIGCMSFHYIPRQFNRSAHRAAQGVEFISIRYTPTHLLEILEREFQENFVM